MLQAHLKLKRYSMIIGLPKEIKPNENRVGLVPVGVETLRAHGHTVLVETTAGVGSGFDDAAYRAAGAKIIKTAKEVYHKSDMIVKVKEPIKQEYGLIKPGQIVFTYFHFAASKELTNAMMKSKAVCIAYETVQKRRRFAAVAHSDERSCRADGTAGRRKIS